MKTKKLLNALVLVVLSVVMSLSAVACASKKYTVSLDANGGTLAGGQTSVTVTLNKNYTLPTPTKVGYTFEGWMQGTSLIPTTGKWTIESDISVKASWTERIYNITLDVNGGTALETTALTAKMGDYVQLPTPVKDGYVFQGWTLNGDIIATPNTVITWEYDGDANLVAKWAGTTTQVTISANGGQGLVNPVVVATKGEVLALPTLTKEGYDFAGWELNEQAFDATQPWSFNGATATLVAKWTAKTYTITLDVNGGNALAENTVTVTFNESFTLPTVTKTGSQIDKWLYNGQELNVTEPWTIAENATLVVQWKAATTLVTFDVNGGVALEGDNTSATFTYGETVTLPTTTKYGYNLVGWKLGETVYTAASTWDVDLANTTLVAVWQAKTIPVTFNVKGGEAVANTTFTFGEVPYADASLVPTTNKAHCTFAGWTYNGELVDLTSIWTVDGEIELVVKWQGTETTVTVKYGLGIEDETVTVLYGDVFDFGYERAGYILNGFVLEGTETAIAISGNEWAYTEDKTIVANWSAKTYNVTVKDYDGTVLNETPIEVTYDAKTNLAQFAPIDEDKVIEVDGVLVYVEKTITVDGKTMAFDGFKVEGTETKLTGNFFDFVWNYDSETQDIVLVISYEEDTWI